MTDTDRLARVALNCLYEAGSPRVAKLVTERGPSAALSTLLTSKSRADTAARKRLGDADPYESARQELDRAKNAGARLIAPGDAAWPEALDDLDDCHGYGDGASYGDDLVRPLCLWVRGPLDLAQATDRSVAIVGARAATSYGKHVAGEFGYGVAQRGYGVVSGGAFGIDAAAHRGALAAEGTTVAVLASGVDVAYPAAHEPLLAQIAERGLLVSEWPLGSRPQRHRFLTRNRLIAALSLGTVVVEAAARSGARVTARHADHLRRRVMAVPGPITSPQSFGCHEMFRDHWARLVTSASHVVQEVGVIGEELDTPTWGYTAHARDRLTPLGARILECVPSEGGVNAEELAVDAYVSPRDVRRFLPELIAAGFVVETPAGYRAVLHPAPQRAVPAQLR